MAFPALLAAMGGGGGAAGAGGAAASAVKGLDAVKGSLGQVTSAAKKGAQAIQAIPGKLGAMTKQAVDILAVGINSIRAMAAPLENFVAMSNPAAVKQFTLAVNDASAVLGRVLLPVFNALTRGARIMGDTYATLEDSFRPAMEGIGDAFISVFETMGKMAKENAFAIEVMANVIGNAAKAAAWATNAVLKLTSAFGGAGILKAIGDLLGIGPVANKSGRGAAVRSVNIGGSGEDAARKATEAAFMQGLNAGKPEDKVVNGLDAIKTWLNANLSKAALMDMLYKTADKIVVGLMQDGKQGTAANASSALGATGGPGLGLIGRAAASLLTR